MHLLAPRSYEEKKQRRKEAERQRKQAEQERRREEVRVWLPLPCIAKSGDLTLCCAPNWEH